MFQLLVRVAKHEAILQTKRCESNAREGGWYFQKFPLVIMRASLAHLSDAQSLLTEYYEAVGVTKRDSPDEIAAFLSDASSGLWIKYVDGTPAGCVVLRPIPSPGLAGELSMECKRLYVRPLFRGKGIAESLLEEMEQYAATLSEWVYLDSKDDLTDALRIYKRRGYRPCERYNDNPQATVFLRKNLRGEL